MNSHDIASVINIKNTGYQEITESADPGAPAAAKARLLHQEKRLLSKGVRRLTVTYQGRLRFGTSSDAKPVNEEDNKTIFVETDTGRIYIKVSGSYSRILL